GELALELSASCGEDGQVCLGRGGAGLGEESRLAHPGARLDHDQPPGAARRGFDVGVDRGELGLTFEERWTVRLRSGHGRAARTERREAVRQALRDELEELLGAVEPRQTRLPEGAKLELGRELVLDEGRRGAGDEDLAAVPEVADARRLV